MKPRIYKRVEPTGLKKFNIILNWCKEHPFGDVIKEHDSYCIRILCWNELRDIQYITEEDIACCYKILGYSVHRVIERKGFQGRWYISKNKSI